MIVHGVTPILNVSSVVESIEWFRQLGWETGFKWGEPPSFGSVCFGDFSIFLGQNGQGSRGKSELLMTFGPAGDDTADKGSWMSIWVDDVDEFHRRCLDEGLEVKWPPTDMEWNVREMHVRHPDGHVLRISRGLDGD